MNNMINLANQYSKIDNFSSCGYSNLNKEALKNQLVQLQKQKEQIDGDSK